MDTTSLAKERWGSEFTDITKIVECATENYGLEDYCAEELSAFILLLNSLPCYCESLLHIGSGGQGLVRLLHHEVGFGLICDVDDGLHPKSIERGQHLVDLVGVRSVLSPLNEAHNWLRERFDGQTFDVVMVDRKGDVQECLDLALRYAHYGSLVVVTNAFTETSARALNTGHDRRHFTAFAAYVGSDSRGRGIHVGMYLGRAAGRNVKNYGDVHTQAG